MGSEPPDNLTTKSSPPPGTGRELNRLEVLRGLRISTWEASFSTVHAALTTGAFLTGYALWLGADAVALGFLTAIPTFAGLIQIVSSYFTERLSSRKAITAWCSGIARTLWLVIALLPLALGKSTLMPFLLLYAISFAMLNVPAPAWMSWMSDLVPANHRGRYFAHRNMIAGIVGMLIGLPAAWFLDYTTKQHHWGTLGFGTLFGVAVLGGLASFVCLWRQPEPPRHPQSTADRAGADQTGVDKAGTDKTGTDKTGTDRAGADQNGADKTGGLRDVLAYYRTPFADPNFRRLMAFNTLFGMGQFFAAPFFNVYALQYLHFDYVWLQIFATMSSVASLLSMPLWGWLSDRFGNKPLLVIAVYGVFTLPLTWMLATPAHPGAAIFLVSELSLAGGLFWAGVGLTQFNLLIGLSPPQKTSIYVATMAAVTGLMGGLAPLMGSAVMQALAGWHAPLLGITLLNYHVTFFISAILRLIALIFLSPLHDAHATTTRDVLQQLGRPNLRAWRNIRQLQRPVDEETRLRATEALGEARTRLALEELVTAMSDPSQAVREEAARALGEIGDPGAVDALIAALRDPATGLTAEAARALARIGDRRANSALISLLEDEGADLARTDRLAVVQALGQLAGSDAVDALLAALRDSDDAEMAEALVTALGRIGSARATAALLVRLTAPDTPRSLCLALVRALGEIGDQTALPALRAHLAGADCDAVLVPVLADSLARLGDIESVLPLADRLEELESAVARKQVAHAIGRLLGVGDSLYGLLSREEFARDEAVARLLQEIQRHLKAQGGGALRTILSTYTLGDYAACVRAALQVGQETETATASDAATTDLRRPLYDLLAHIASRSDAVGNAPSLESTLLALCALRGLC